MLPTVLMNALKEYTFVGSPLWRMSDGKDLVRVELTFHKVLPTKSYKKRAESKRQPAPSAGECLRQPAPAGDRRRRRPTPCMEQEVFPPSPQTLPDTARDYITYDRTQKTAIIEPSPVIKKPATPPSTPDSPPKKRSRLNSPPEPTRDPSEAPEEIFYDVFSKPFPLHDKYDLQDVHHPTFENFEAVINDSLVQTKHSTWTYQFSSCFIWNSKTGISSRDQHQRSTTKSTTRQS